MGEAVRRAAPQRRRLSALAALLLIVLTVGVLMCSVAQDSLGLATCEAAVRLNPSDAALRGASPDHAGADAAGVSGRGAHGRVPLPPHISKFSPTKAPSRPGSVVTITGSRFRSEQGTKGGVSFIMSAKKAVDAAIRSWSNTKIVCTVPEGIWSGEVKVRDLWSRSSNAVPFEVTYMCGTRRLAEDARTYRVHANSKDGDFTELVKAAIEEWNDAGSNFVLVPDPEGDGQGAEDYRAYSKDGHNDIFWSTTIPPDATARTTAMRGGFNSADGKTTAEDDIWLNDNLSWGDGSPGSGTYDVQSVLLHELGHVVELGDLYGKADRGKVMYYGLDPGTQRRSLGAGEIAGVQWLYGRRSAVGETFPICTTSEYTWHPDISGNWVVWEDWRWDQHNIFAFDLSAKKERLVTSAGNGLFDPAISGTTVVWQDGRRQNWTIYGIDFLAGDEFPVCDWHYDHDGSPAVSGDVVVWSDGRGGPPYDEYSHIFGRNLKTNTEFSVCKAFGGQWSASISGNIVVWSDGRNEESYSANGSDIYGKNLVTGQEFPVCTAPGDQWDPDVSGSIVVWTDERGEGDDNAIYGYNLATKKQFIVCSLPGIHDSPRVSGNIVVWSDSRTGVDAVFGYDIVTGNEFRVSPVGKFAQDPEISGKTVVWQGAGIWGCVLRR